MPDQLSAPAIDWAAWRRRREDALARKEHAWLAALLSSGLSALLPLWIAFDEGEWGALWPYAIGLALNVALARLVQVRHSQLAAGILLANALLTPAYRWMTTGRPGPIVLIAVLVYVYWRAFDATLTLAEYRKATADAPAV
jgi:hypothetical protein